MKYPLSLKNKKKYVKKTLKNLSDVKEYYKQYHKYK